VVGYVSIKGDNVTAGYYNNPEDTARVLRESWLNTGDLGFFHAGTLYITGRAKDVFFIHGQNYYSHDLERNLEEAEGP
jgi:polyketide synthase PksJ